MRGDVFLAQLLLLFDQSPYYGERTVQRLVQTVLPPLLRGHCVCIEERGVVVAWASWAFVDGPVIDKIKSGYLIKADDFDSGETLLCLDFIAPFGHARALARRMRMAHGARRAVWFRRTRGDRLCEVTANGK